MSAPILPERGPNRRPDGPPAARGHLERLIGHYAELTGIAPDRVRRWVSVMVLLGALDRVGEEEMPRFLLKGGIAIELRFGTDARATKDVDLVFFGNPSCSSGAISAVHFRTSVLCRARWSEALAAFLHDRDLLGQEWVREGVEQLRHGELVERSSS